MPSTRKLLCVVLALLGAIASPTVVVLIDYIRVIYCGVKLNNSCTDVTTAPDITLVWADIFHAIINRIASLYM